MPQTASPAVDFSADADLISFLQAVPDGRYRRGVRYPQWYVLLMAVLGILSGCRSSRDLEAFAKHHAVLNQALGLNLKRWPTDATFLYLYRFAEACWLQQCLFAAVRRGAAGLDDQPDPRWGSRSGSVGLRRQDPQGLRHRDR
jgi:hypothetical protein